MYFVFPSPMTMVAKITRKEMSKLLFQNYDKVKCRQNVSFEEVDTERPAGKNEIFWLLWGIFKECILQNIIMAALRKTNSHSIVICRLIKKIKNVTRYKEKSWLSAYEVLKRINVI